VLAPSDGPEVRGAGLLRGAERGFLHLDRALGRVLPEALNPFLHTGAIAITCLVVATVTGIVLLIWYRPSVHLAYESVAAMSDAPWTAGLLRSLHRYSSDAGMFFGLVHALRLFLERRFTGPRWLAWFTGFASLGILWFIGWTGYWLVWDVRAQYVAVGSAHVLDALPIFADPMGRSFLTDGGINSLLFFVVFFVHMLVPLAIGLTLWLHLARLARPRFLTRRPMTIWTLGLLLLLCIVYPAESAEPARMTAISGRFGMDWWYLAPLALTDRLGAASLWSLMLVSGAIGGTVPWWMRRRHPARAHVTVSRCNSCRQCYRDCPFNAISMVDRSDGREHLYPAQAEVDPGKCVGCGICVGSCTSIGTDMEGFGLADVRRRIEGWVREAAKAGETVQVALVCAESAGAVLSVDPSSGVCAQLPGYRVLEIPCAGWVHALTVDRLLKRGAGSVVIVSCAPGRCYYREGIQWMSDRLDGTRVPELVPPAGDREGVRILSLDRTQGDALIDELRSFAASETPRGAVLDSPGRRTLASLAATLLAVIVAAGLGVVSDLGYAAPSLEGSELVVSLKHPGAVSENCRALSEAEKAKLAPHMRRDEVCERRRSAVRLRVVVDGETSVDTLYPPTGIWGDGNSIAIERIPVAPGDHAVSVTIGDTADPEEWSYADERVLGFDREARRVVTFDRLTGFVWE
jgi:ferredoxin